MIERREIMEGEIRKCTERKVVFIVKSVLKITIFLVGARTKALGIFEKEVTGT